MRQTLQTLFGLDLSTGQKWIIAFAVILVLLALLGLFARQIKGGRLRIKGQGGGRARQPRLGVVDMYDLDRQRQLVLIRRDNVEHLLMIGGVSDVVVETNILRSGARAPAPAQVEIAERAAPQDPGPAGETPRGDTSTADLLPPLPSRPSQPSPVATRPPQQRPIEAPLAAAVAAAAAVTAAPAVAAALREQAAAAPVDVPTPTVQPPSFARDHAPSPAASEVELDSMTRQLEEALKRPYSAVRQSQPAVSPEPVEAGPSVPEPAKDLEPAEAEPARIELPPIVPPPAPPDTSRRSAEPAEPAPPVESAPLPSPTPPAPPVKIGKPIPLPADVEAELEMALGLKPQRAEPFAAPPRPAQAFSPAALPAPPPEEPSEPEPEPAAAAPEVIVTPPPAPMPETAADDTMPPEPKSEAPAALTAEGGEPGREAEVALPAQKPVAIDPFSVDAIEAEFARLLGRDPKAKG